MPGPIASPVNLFSAADPGLAERQLNLQQQQALANSLMQQGMEPINPYQSTGRYLAKVTPLQGVAKMAQAYAGALMQKEGNKQQADLQAQQLQALRGMFGGGQQQPNPMSPNAASPSVMAGATGTTPAPQTAQQGQSQGGGFGIPGMSPDQAMMTYLADPNAFMTGYMKNYAPINVRPGGTVYTPGQGPQFTAPQNGVQTQWGQQGPFQSVLPGAPEAAGAMAYPPLAARAAVTPERGVGPNGPTFVPGGALAATQGPGATFPGGPGYQPQGLPGQGAPQAPRSGPIAPAYAPNVEAAQKENEIQLAQEASKGREAANIAVDTNYNLQHVLDSAQGFETGKFAPTFMSARAYLQGAAPELFPPAEMNKLKDFQELQKYSIRLGFDQARKMGARESTQIVQMSIESNPNPQMVGPAIKAIGHGLMAQNDYVIAKEKARDAWAKGHQGTLSGFNSQWQDLADPKAFLIKYQSPQEQANMFSKMSDGEKGKLLKQLQALRQTGIL